MPPYTDTAGRGTVRIGKDCKPLIGTVRRRLLDQFGANDFTGATVDGPLSEIISPAAMESLRAAARVERAPSEMIRLRGADLLEAIGVLRDGRPTRAAVLLAGSPQTIRRHIPMLMPVGARRELMNLPDDLWTKVNIEFYRDAEDGVFKLLE